jgi:hypothetical protein
MPLHPDWKEFLELLNSNGVDYLIVGAHALGHHGIPRYTRDIDLLVRPSLENGAKLVHALAQFGFGSLKLRAEDFLEPGNIIQLGVEPYRIDLLTSITGVPFEDAWKDKEPGTLDGVSTTFLSRGMFKKNKLATGRLKDLADVDALVD